MQLNVQSSLNNVYKINKKNFHANSHWKLSFKNPHKEGKTNEHDKKNVKAVVPANSPDVMYPKHTVVLCVWN